MVMPNTDGPIDPKNAAGHSEARKPTTVPPPSAASPELSPRPQRRTFSAAAKLRILAETDRHDGKPARAGVYFNGSWWAYWVAEHEYFNKMAHADIGTSDCEDWFKTHPYPKPPRSRRAAAAGKRRSRRAGK